MKTWSHCSLAHQPAAETFQGRVQPWMLETFGAEIAGDVTERGDRLLEEVLELLQSHGYDPGRVATLRDYVFNRPVGVPPQEVGGVMVTLAAYCLATGIDMHEAGEVELARVWTKIETIRSKQASKKGLHTPLPVRPQQPAAVDERRLDTERMDAVKRLRLAVTPVEGGGWDVTVFGAQDCKETLLGSGADVRSAIDEAIDLAGQQQGGPPE